VPRSVRRKWGLRTPSRNRFYAPAGLRDETRGRAIRGCLGILGRVPARGRIANRERYLHRAESRSVAAAAAIKSLLRNLSSPRKKGSSHYYYLFAVRFAGRRVHTTTVHRNFLIGLTLVENETSPETRPIDQFDTQARCVYARDEKLICVTCSIVCLTHLHLFFYFATITYNNCEASTRQNED